MRKTVTGVEWRATRVAGNAVVGPAVFGSGAHGHNALFPPETLSASVTTFPVLAT